MKQLIRIIILLASWIIGLYGELSWVKVEIEPGKQTVIIEQLVPVKVSKIGTSTNSLKIYISSDYRMPAPEKQVIPVNRGLIRAVSWLVVDKNKTILNLEFVGNAIRPKILSANDNIILVFDGEELQKALPDLIQFAESLRMRNPSISSQLLSDADGLKKEESNVVDDQKMEQVSSVDTTKADTSGPVLSFVEELPDEAVVLSSDEGGFDLAKFLTSPITLAAIFVIGLILVLIGLKELLGFKLPFSKKGGGSVPEKEDSERAGKQKNRSEEVSEEESFSAKLSQAIEEANLEDRFQRTPEVDKSDVKKGEEVESVSTQITQLKKDRVVDHNIIYQLYLQGNSPEYLAKELKLSLSEIQIAMKIAEESSDIGSDKREKIFQMSKVGLSNAQIASRLKLNVESVNLILWQGQA